MNTFSPSTPPPLSDVGQFSQTLTQANDFLRHLAGFMELAKKPQELQKAISQLKEQADLAVAARNDANKTYSDAGKLQKLAEKAAKDAERAMEEAKAHHKAAEARHAELASREAAATEVRVR
jgi:uncharacterized coiled-coil DUF342 family protein